MKEIIRKNPNNIKFDIEKLYTFRKCDKSPLASEKITTRLNKAYDLFCQIAEPASLVEDLTYSKFQFIYSGEGLNEKRTPINDMPKDAASYFLFAMTLGPDVSRQITALFKNGEHLLGHLLDNVCSVGIEVFANDITNRYFTREVTRGTLQDNDVMLRYSPGYCGWHISGQRILHEYLKSSDIGIKLTKKCYMEPIKSISGVMIGGHQSIHCFTNNYSFCGECRTRKCRNRLAMIL